MNTSRFRRTNTALNATLTGLLIGVVIVAISSIATGENAVSQTRITMTVAVVFMWFFIYCGCTTMIHHWNTVTAKSLDRCVLAFIIAVVTWACTMSLISLWVNVAPHSPIAHWLSSDFGSRYVKTWGDAVFWLSVVVMFVLWPIVWTAIEFIRKLQK